MHHNTLCKKTSSVKAFIGGLELLPFTEQLRHFCRAAWMSAVQMHAVVVHDWIIGSDDQI